MITPRTRFLHEFTYQDIRQAVDPNFIHHGEYRRETERRGVRYVPYNPSSPQNSSHVGYMTAATEVPIPDNDPVFFALYKTPMSPRSIERGYPQRFGTDAWYQTVSFLDFKDAMNSPGETMADRVYLMMMSGDIALHCTCPSFKYWGYWYIMNGLDAAVYAQNIRPDVRNPQMKGVICKHLDIILKVMPFYRSDFTRDIRAQGFDFARDEGFEP